MSDIPCPFTYANGRSCTGTITRIETYKADIEWRLGEDGKWRFGWSDRMHYHLFCSERGNHAGYKQRDDDRMKFFYRDLPDEVKTIIDSTQVQTEAATERAL